APRPPAPALTWHEFAGGLIEVGAPAQGFSFDNEHPRHRQFLEPFALAGRLVTNGEYQAFIADGGYQDPQWWLSEAWDTLRSENWQRPLHWRDDDHVFSLQGLQSIDGNAPVSHLSGYEADAFARWSGCRLPTEFEWEHAAQGLGVGPESAGLSPRGSASGWFGDVWQWTQSAYAPYPGFKPDAGAVGEYNGKFMSSQWVLRGGSFATPRAQQRISYRNFFYPRDRWQFTGLRLAKTLVPA
ncbi:MAG: SUMF1/EgtB/PvdO family nonheme iron enzyme, partial [Luminiphilus sp.]